ncbi:MAG TPA: outer membrane beta-barrel protein [Xanthobacteraceae bacterium]|jgi:outer membrane immunogenic protein|nr:outer membrane beta-barrel protein [Xanthobacteraceae bacterium]
MRSILAAAVLTLLSCPAFAQSYLWTGFYAGLHLGGMTVPGTQFTGSNLATPGAPAGSAAFAAETAQNLTGSTSDSARVMGGAQIGYNWRINQAFVAGIETDISKVSRHADILTRNQPFAGFPGFTVNSGLTSPNYLEYLGTVRARFGYVVAEPLLLYLTGGLAYGQTDSTTQFIATSPGTALTPPTGTFGGRSVRAGYTVGGGLEYAVYRNVSLKAEGLFYDMGSTTDQTVFNSFSAGVFVSTTGVSRTTNLNGVIARVGVNCLF